MSSGRRFARTPSTSFPLLSMVRVHRLLRMSILRTYALLVVASTGKAPFKASYKLAKGSHQADAVPRTLASIQSRADLTLFTAVAGHHTYTFTGVGDFLYTTPSDKGLIAPEGGRHGVVRLEQDVFPLPSAAFLHGPKRGFCVNDPLASRTADDLILRLEGTAPFEVELEVREDGHRQAKRFTIPNIRTKEWPVVLPFDLTTPSAHSITLRRVSDAHGCERIIDAVATPSTASVIVPVAEIATIAPVLPQTEHCVGDFLEYVVQGAPPFTVKYEFEGKKHAVPLSSSKFSRLAAKPGTFKIVSVGHGDDECRANTVDLCVHESTMRCAVCLTDFVSFRAVPSGSTLFQPLACRRATQ